MSDDHVAVVEIDWVSAPKFEDLTGIPRSRFYDLRKDSWKQGEVWVKVDNRIYYSVTGFNKWLNQQAKNCLQECESAPAASKSTLSDANSGTTSRSHTRRLRRVSRQPLKLELN